MDCYEAVSGTSMLLITGLVELLGFTRSYAKYKSKALKKDDLKR